MTRSEQIELYGKCLYDPIFTIEKFFMTFDLTQKGNVPFRLFHKQKEIIQSYETNNRIIVTKPRQAGVSTTTAAYIASKIAFGDPKNPWKVLILANKQTLAQEFLQKIRDFLDQVPNWVWGIDDNSTYLSTDSKGHIKIKSTKCEVKALATSKDALRGYTPTFLIMDEAAFIDNGSEVFGAALTSLGTGGKISLISTPNGLDELYYKTYDGAKTGKNNFKIVEMRWHQDIRYNRNLRWLKGDDDEIKCENVGRSKLRWEYNGIIYETSETSIENYDVMIKDGWKPSSFWYESMCEDMNGDVRQIAQELDVSFVGSGGNVIDEKYIEYHSQNNVIDPEFTAELEKKMWIWKKPEIGHKYLMGVDVARGDGKDSSTIVILDFENLEQVAEYQGMIPPDFLAQLVFKYGNMYSAYTIIDITGGMGVSTVVKLQELGYKHLHLDNSKTKILQDKRSIDKYVNVENKTPGFNVGSNRLHMITELEEHIREGKTIIRSTRLISELKTFVYKNGRPDHMEGYHDDLIMALAMCIFIIQTSFKNLEKVTQQTKAMLESWVTTSNSVPTTKIYNDTNSQFYFNTNNHNQQSIPINNDPNQDFNWLFGFNK
jgi:hypothetical protein